MKKQVYLIIVFSILSLNLFAQLIPDDNFKAVINYALGQPPNYEPTVEDLNGLTGQLDASNAGISSIEGAQYLINLTNLILGSNQISNISYVSDLTNLIELHLYINQISDISAVSGLTNMNYLTLDNNQISDISAVSGLTDLRSLLLDNNQISDISAVSGLTDLSGLYLSNNQISDISAVSGLTDLSCLSLGFNQISDISAVSGLAGMNYLYLTNNQINDISAVSSLTNLLFLLLFSNQISDISAISDLTDLRKLYLYNNQISDISAVFGLTELLFLHLYNNQINDISAVSNLTNLRELYLYNNQISDIYALVENTGLGSGDKLLLEYNGHSNPISKEALNVHIPILVSRGFNILQYPSNPNVYAACYPYPIRDATELPTNTTLEWSGNFPSRDAIYDVWLGETSDNLVNIGNGVAITDTLYSFTPNLNEDTNYWWKVRAITDTDTIWSGLWHFSVGNPISVEEEIQSLNASRIVSNFPNPFNPTTTIEFSIQNNSKVELSIYNIKGQKIKTLTNNEFTKGPHSIVWNGDDESGKSMGSGVYLYKLNVNNKAIAVKKCLLLK